MAQFSPESWLNSNRNGGSRRSDRWLKIARNIQDIIAKGYIHGIPIVLDVECKQYRPDRKIGIGIVQRMRAVQADDHANKSVIVTTSSFSSDAREYADDHMIALVDMDGIKQWLRDAVQQNK